MPGKNDIIQEFNKRFGEGTFFTFDDPEISKVYPIPTGISSFDYALGIGGLPLGRIVEFFGPESSGKTTVALKVIAEAQKLAKDPQSPLYGKRTAYIDAEHALDPIHVENLGVDVSRETGMLINQPDSGEEVFDLCESICTSEKFSVCVVDSVAALVPLKELEEGMDYNPIGLQARMMSQGLRKLKGLANKHGVLLLFINQIRHKVGVMYGNPETTPGGHALKFYASVRVDIRKKEIKQKDVFIGQTITATIKKNKVSRPHTKAEFDYYWDTGIDVVKDIMNVALMNGVINRAGAYYFMGEDAKNPVKDVHGNELKWQGKDNLLESLKQSPELFDYIYNVVLGKIPKGAQYVEEEKAEETSD